MKFFYTLLLTVLSISMFAQDKTANDSIKQMDSELNEVVIDKKKKAVERTADRVIFDFSEQDYLNSGSLMEGLRKLPGLIISEVGGVMYQGKGLQVYMDGRPLNIYSNELNAYLEGMPANTVEKVEIITNPGAEFPATSGGAIINIVTAKNAKKYLSATYSNGYSYTNYDKARHRFNNSVTLSAANKLFSWQLQGGQSYGESYNRGNFYSPDAVITNNYSDRYNRYYYLRTGVKFDFKYDRLLVNYNITTSNNSSYVEASGLGFTASDKSHTKNFYNDVALTYQKRFENPFKKLDFVFNYNNNDGNFDQQSRISQTDVLSNDSNQDFYQFKTDYSQDISLLDKGKISAGVLADLLDFQAMSFGTTNLDYRRSSYAAYAEAQTTYKKLEFIAGGRLESYNIEGNTDTDDLIPFNQTRFFYNGTVQYTLIPQIYAKANYNKKISLPDTSSLNPNNTNYQNPNIEFYGNPNLEPTIYNNYEIELNAFEYFFINYSITEANNAITTRVITTDEGTAARVSENVDKVTTRNFNFGIPVPYMLFTKGLTETLKMDFNPDEINFLYIYVGSRKNIIPGLDTKAVWNFNLMSQLILPKKVKFTANFNTTSSGGNYLYYTVKQPIYQRLDLTFSRKFLSDNLSLSVYVNDVFNTNTQNYGLVGTNLSSDNKYDSRRIGFSLNYKIPGKNKQDKQEDILNNNTPQQKENTIGN